MQNKTVGIYCTKIPRKQNHFKHFLICQEERWQLSKFPHDKINLFPLRKLAIRTFVHTLKKVTCGTHILSMLYLSDHQRIRPVHTCCNCAYASDKFRFYHSYFIKITNKYTLKLRACVENIQVDLCLYFCAVQGSFLYIWIVLAFLSLYTADFPDFLPWSNCPFCIFVVFKTCIIKLVL